MSLLLFALAFAFIISIATPVPFGMAAVLFIAAAIVIGSCGWLSARVGGYP